MSDDAGKTDFFGAKLYRFLTAKLTSVFEAKSYSLATKLTLSRKNLQSVRGGEVIYRSGGENQDKKLVSLPPRKDRQADCKACREKVSFAVRE